MLCCTTKSMICFGLVWIIASLRGLCGPAAQFFTISFTDAISPSESPLTNSTVFSLISLLLTDLVHLGSLSKPLGKACWWCVCWIASFQIYNESRQKVKLKVQNYSLLKGNNSRKSVQSHTIIWINWVVVSETCTVLKKNQGTPAVWKGRVMTAKLC